MPRSTFAVGALQGATPGLSRLAASIAGGDQSYQGGFDQGVTGQSKIAQALAAIRASDAAAAAHTADAGLKGAEANVITGRPAVVNETIAAQTGSTLPMVQAVQDFIRTGQQQMKPAMGPAEEDGTQASQFPVVDNGTQSKIMTAISQMTPFLTNKGDIGYDSYAKGRGEFRDQGLSQDVIDGRLNRNTVAGGQAAAAGKPLYHFGENGTVGDLFGGGLDESSGTAKGNIGLIGQKTLTEKAREAEQRAAAANQYAAAGSHNASAARTRQETEQGLKNGNLKLEKDADGRIIVVDLVKGTSTPTTDTTTGQPVKARGPAEKPLAESAQKQLVGTRNLQDAVDNYRRVLAGFPVTDMGRPDRRAAMGNAYNNMMLQAKEAYNLGVLNGPDYEILQSVVKDPTKWSSLFTSNEALSGQAASLKDIAANIERTVLESHGRAYTPRVPAKPTGNLPANLKKPGAAPPAAPANEADYNALPSGATYTAPDGSVRTKR